MKTNLKLMFALAACWLTGVSAWAIEPVNGVYQIGTAQDWADFCTLHNEGTDQKLNAELTADITVVGNTMIGINGSGKPYRGVFDGKGHKLTISYNLNEERVAPFRRINGATIKNLIVEGTITTSSKLASGLVGGLWQNGSTIQNCVSYVVINDDQGGDATHGGICGSFEDVNGANTIENCAFLGEINAPNREGCGGIVGWTNNNNNNNIIRNCLVKAAGFKVKTGSNNDIICRNNGNVVNCYYIGSITGMTNIKNATAATDAQAASGEICFLLNGSQSVTPEWFQSIGTDAVPLPLGTAIVYANGSLSCDGTPKGDVTFSNTESQPQRDDHQWNEWGFCSNCDEIQPDFLKADEQGFYPIADKKGYNWCMMMINKFGEPNMNAKLTQDLDLSDYTFVPIGVDGRNFAGIFDGQGHRIKNMTIDGTKKEQGFFSTCQGGAVIKNLIIDSSCKMVGTGGDNVAALIGCVNHNNFNNDVVLIQNVGNEMSFNVTTTNNAGFIARDFSNFLKVQIVNCYNTGNIMGGTENGAFTAWTPNVTLTNCWNTGRIEKTGGYNGSKSLARGNQPKFFNSYDLNSENTDNAGAPEGYVAEWLTSGKFAYLLNGNQSADVNWYQVLGENADAYPYPFGTAVVYANGSLHCDGITPKEGTEVTFSNTEGSTVDAHQFANGLCSVCGGVQLDYLTPVEGVYAIADANQLNWFAHYTGKVNAAVNAMLTADIDMKDISDYPGIGSEAKRFTGVFDGQGHLIKNLVVDTPNDRAAGLIRFAAAPLTVQNLTMDASCSFKAKNYAGGIIGDLNGTGAVALSQLGNEATVTTVDENAGGIVGCNFSGEAKITLTNSYNAGAISSGKEAGGLSGWFGNDAVLTNCYNMGTVANGESFARGNNIQITNCFDPVTNWETLTKVDMVAFTDGTVYDLLVTAAGKGIWFLSAEEDGHPVVYNTGIVTAIRENVAAKNAVPSAVYNLNGQRVNSQFSTPNSQLKKGLYIINGRKVVLK